MTAVAVIEVDFASNDMDRIWGGGCLNANTTEICVILLATKMPVSVALVQGKEAAVRQGAIVDELEPGSICC